MLISHDTKRAGNTRIAASHFARILGLGVLAAGLFNHPGFAADDVVHSTQRAFFAQESASHDARHVADWVVDSHDNLRLPFVIVDKKNAKVFVFDASGQLKGAAPALLGMAYGDDSAPGIGQRQLSRIRVDERTTPAGRFVGSLARNLKGEGILWVDYDAAISLHRVVTSNLKQQRAQRLATSTIADNRISLGCINVSAKFYDQVIQTAFENTNGIIYVLPETRSMQDTFGSYDVDAHALQLATSVPLLEQTQASSVSVIKLR